VNKGNWRFNKCKLSERTKKTRGNDVKAQVGTWNEQVSTQRRAWSDYGNALKTGLASEKRNTRRRFEQERADLARQLREQREIQETQREEMMARIEEHNRQQATRIKAETAASVTDESKRLFFTQRKIIANNVTKMEERWRQERASAKEEHLRRALDGVAAAKATRGGGRQAKMVLVGERGAAAKELRDKRNALREQKADEERNLQKQIRDRREELHANKFISTGMIEQMQNQQQSKLRSKGAPSSAGVELDSAPDLDQSRHVNCDV